MKSNSFEVFISRKSEDSLMAKEVYDFLIENNIKPFDSDQSLKRIGKSDFYEAIFNVIEEVNHFILVCSDTTFLMPNTTTKQNVYNEWNHFFGLISSGEKKHSNIIVILSDIAIDSPLPPRLKFYQKIKFSEFKSIILPYLGHHQSDDNSLEDSNNTNNIRKRSTETSQNQDKENKLANIPKAKNKLDNITNEINKEAEVKKTVTPKEKKVKLNEISDLKSELNIKPASQNIISKTKDIENKAIQKEQTVEELMKKGLSAKNNKNFTEAIKYFDEAALLNSITAINEIGEIFFYGYGVNKNYKLSYQWFLKAAEMGDGNAMNWIGNFYYNGWDCEIDYSKSLEWYLKAADSGSIAGVNNVGNQYLNGIGTEKKYDKALKYLTIASNYNNPYAIYNLGVMYHDGLGVPIDIIRAKQLFEKSLSLVSKNENLVNYVNVYLDRLNKRNESQNNPIKALEEVKSTGMQKVDKKVDKTVLFFFFFIFTLIFYLLYLFVYWIRQLALDVHYSNIFKIILFPAVISSIFFSFMFLKSQTSEKTNKFHENTTVLFILFLVYFFIDIFTNLYKFVDKIILQYWP